MTVFAHSQTTNKLVNEAANDSARVSGQDRKNRPIRLQDLEDSFRPQAWKKNPYRKLRQKLEIKVTTVGKG